MGKMSNTPCTNCPSKRGAVVAHQGQNKEIFWVRSRQVKGSNSYRLKLTCITGL